MKKNKQKTKAIQRIDIKIGNLDSEEWYSELIDECKAIVVETQFWSSIEIIKGRWLLGERILETRELAKRKESYGKKIVQRIAEDISISSSQVWRSIQFAKKFPNLVVENDLDLDPFVEGKNISWKKIISNYLPNLVKKSTTDCEHEKINQITFFKCQKCKEQFGAETKLLDSMEREEILNNYNKKHETK